MATRNANATPFSRVAHQGQGMVEFSGAVVMAGLSVVCVCAVGGYVTGALIVSKTMASLSALLTMVA